MMAPVKLGAEKMKGKEFETQFGPVAMFDKTCFLMECHIWTIECLSLQVETNLMSVMD